jgi:hypothetical protein
MEAKELKLIRTCSECPEQYDVIYKDHRIGFLHYRWGLFEASIYRRNDYKPVYTEIIGGEFDGILPPDRRAAVLKKGLEEVAKYFSIHPNAIILEQKNIVDLDMDEDGYEKL